MMARLGQMGDLLDLIGSAISTVASNLPAIAQVATSVVNYETGTAQQALLKAETQAALKAAAAAPIAAPAPAPAQPVVLQTSSGPVVVTSPSSISAGQVLLIGGGILALMYFSGGRR
jgi:hypothetical protein